MSEHEIPTGQELRDLADLDALGLLDEIDQKRFERALADATIAEQDRIRDRQAALVERLVGEPTEALPEDLKQRVMDAVRCEIEQFDASLAPIARIGRRKRERMQREEELAAQGAGTGSGFASLELRGVRRSAVIWRAASFALAASLVAAIFFLYDTTGSALKIEELAYQQVGSEELREVYGEQIESVLATPGNKVFGLATVDLVENAANANDLAENAANAKTMQGAFNAVLNAKENTLHLITLAVTPGEYSIHYEDEQGVARTIPFSVGLKTTVIDVGLNGELPTGLARHLQNTSWDIRNSSDQLLFRCNPQLSA